MRSEFGLCFLRKFNFNFWGFFFSIKITSLPDGTVKLEIDHVKPTDSGAYKLVLSNPNGESIAICAVAVKRKLFFFLNY